MATEPITIEIIFELMYISIGLVIFGLILNKILGLKKSVMKELRENTKNLQERLIQAQVLGDARIIQELQVETMQLMKQMLKKQLLPMGIRCIIFLGIFFVISFFYGHYEYWFWIYFLWSLCFSLLSFGLTKLYKKVTGKEDKRKTFAKEIQSSFFISNTSSETHNSFKNNHELKNEEDNQESERSDAWKDRIQD
jgi:hypothetical protein